MKQAIVLKAFPIDEGRMFLRLYAVDGVHDLRLPYLPTHSGDLGFIIGKKFEIAESPARRWFHDLERLRAISTLINHLGCPHIFELCYHFLETILEDHEWSIVYERLLKKIIQRNPVEED